LIVGDGCRLVAVVHVSLRKAVVGIAWMRISFDVELENTDGFLELLASISS